jgi:hypothetical protein
MSMPTIDTWAIVCVYLQAHAHTHRYSGIGRRRPLSRGGERVCGATEGLKGDVRSSYDEFAIVVEASSRPLIKDCPK